MRKLILIIMLIILATFTIPIIFTIRLGDGEKNVKETGGTVENIGNNELNEEKHYIEYGKPNLDNNDLSCKKLVHKIK